MGAILISDFDGTAVEKLEPKPWQVGTHIRNMGKWGLSMIPGYDDFIYGVLSVDGVDLSVGYLTVRKEWLRRKATERTITKQGLDQFGRRAGSVQYAGTEALKGLHLANLAHLERPKIIGMIDDRPDRLVPNLVNSLSRIGHNPELQEAKSRVVIGVVDHRESLDRIMRAMEEVKVMGRANAWDGFYYGATQATNDRGEVVLNSGKMEVAITQLPAYSYEAGVQFGERLVA